jgi:nucleoside 2-deoxyribosyltransferase
MPFSDDYLDQWELAMQPAAHDNQVIIERLDHGQHFTGDIVAEIRNRIERSAGVVALLDAHNPNVFLEVGYAWGVRKPAILLLHDDHDPPFDIKSQRLIRYKRVGQLKTLLTTEIKGLLASAVI